MKGNATRYIALLTEEVTIPLTQPGIRHQQHRPDLDMSASRILTPRIYTPTGSDWNISPQIGYTRGCGETCLPMRIMIQIAFTGGYRAWTMNAIDIPRPTCKSVWKSSTSKVKLCRTKNCAPVPHVPSDRRAILHLYQEGGSNDGTRFHLPGTHASSASVHA